MLIAQDSRTKTWKPVSAQSPELLVFSGFLPRKHSLGEINDSLCFMYRGQL